MDSVLESTRAEEARVKRETAEGLALFRRQQDQADKKARTASGQAVDVPDGSPVAEEESWIAGGRKRKRVKDKEGLKGVKMRKSSTSASQVETHESIPVEPSSLEAKADTAAGSPNKGAQTQTEITTPKDAAEIKKHPPPIKASTLVMYGSDDDDDY